jgi:cytidylate kinase
MKPKPEACECQLKIWVPAPFFERVVEAAARDRRSLSQYSRNLIEDAMDHHSRQEPHAA